MAAAIGKTALNGLFSIQKEEGNLIACCTLCNKKLKYHHSTTTLNYHIKNKHPFTSLSNRKRKPNNNDDDDAGDDTASSSSTCTNKSSFTNTKQQTTLLEHSFSHKRISDAHYQTITKALCLWIARDMRPVAVVEDAGLAELLKIATGDQDFSIPGRTCVMERIKDLYAAKKDVISEKLARADSVVLAVDYWTSVANQSYLGMNVMFMEDWKIKSVNSWHRSYDRQTYIRKHCQPNSITDQPMGTRWQTEISN
jgi:hypothetical protein